MGLNNSRKILVTGAAGFIGFHLCKRILQTDYFLIGLDNLNSYYDTRLKFGRLEELNNLSQDLKKDWIFKKIDLEDISLMNNLFKTYKPDVVIHLAAQAGVRYSLENPISYINSNLVGFSYILECCRNFPVKNLIYASSSSVYGGNTKTPFSEEDPVNHPVSLYAATKRANELMAHSYSHLYAIPATGLRFFTVYGPWGRPDMAPMIFTKAILSNTPIDIYNNGEMSRDFTYIDDVIESIVRLINKPAKANINFDNFSPNPSSSWASHQILNIGNSNSINLMDFIKVLESQLGVKAKKNFKSMQPGDVKVTSADTTLIENLTGYKPNTPIAKGIEKFIKWYRDIYLKI